MSSLGNVMSAEDFEALKTKKAEIWNTLAVNSPLNGIQPVFALLGYDDLRNLEGKLLTIIDASFSDSGQRKAVKSLVRQAIWWHWVPNLDANPDGATGGMPVEESGG